MRASLEFSIVIPVHNEEDLLEESVDQLARQLLAFDTSYELMLCENGSLDGTKAIAASLADKYPFIRVEELGIASYGRAMRHGVLSAVGRYVAVFDIDLWDLEFLRRGLAMMNEYDMVIASKIHPDSNDKRPLIRRLITRILSYTIRLLFRIKTTDTHGLKVFKREKLEPIFAATATQDEILDTEVVIRAEREGLKIVEVPMTVQEIRPGRLAIAHRAIRTLRDFRDLSRALKKDASKSEDSKKMMFFDTIAEDFDDIMNLYDLEKRLDVVFDEIGVDIGTKEVLDAGCGTGWFSKAAVDRGARVTSMDLGDKLLREVKKKCDSEVVQGDVQRMPFDNEAFDVVICTEVIEHTIQPRRSVSELARVVRPGGVLVLTCPNKVWHPVVVMANKLKLRPYEGLENWVGWREITRWLNEEGMIVEKKIGFNIIPFVFPATHGFIRWCDKHCKFMSPVMLNIGVTARKR